MEKLDAFTEAYLTAALWSTNDESDERGGVPMDDNYGISDIHPDTLAQMVADCKAFQEKHADAIATVNSSQAGHDYWLTRNGHGCGFWDGDWPEPAATELDNASEEMGNYNLLVGDDGKIHGYPDKPRLYETKEG